ncbi:Asp/Glu racemase [Sulfitobacter sp. SK012]|uniref:maleate cis-trans isomerase family protein n=1 Tax=Sulfitobacter sp. SK012 TaxID=1389005 RepID=UPI000E0A509A|nr:aspartate/glutamate racemase family protein [Sulfitobacter sp. SK012]AXI47666.1 Asp/Glu racemase [Sulfitobacter sp. SK012]
MTPYSYDLAPETARPLGLIVLQSDETIEGDFRIMLHEDTPLQISRIASALEVSSDSLQQMEGGLTAAASLFPRPSQFASIGYGCTSASAQIGSAKIAGYIRNGTNAEHVTDPLSALVAACSSLGLKRIALLSPYVAQVSDRLRDALKDADIATPSLGSFNEAREENVVRIAGPSIYAAACDLAAQGAVDGIFLSCTNLRTLAIIPDIEAATGLPCLSSNQVLAWHMTTTAETTASIPGQLGRKIATSSF